MPSKGVRIAYLKRMLERLEGEDARLQQQVSAGILSVDGLLLGMQQLKKSRDELLSELKSLGNDIDG